MGEIAWAWLNAGVWFYAVIAASGVSKRDFQAGGCLFLTYVALTWPYWAYLAVIECFVAMRCTCTRFGPDGVIFDVHCPKHKPKPIGRKGPNN